MVDHILEFRLCLPRSRVEVFPFFAAPENLVTVTPRWLHLSVLAAPVELEAGAVIDCQIRWFGVRFRWRSLIREYDPPYRFVDVQLRGPYARWEHRHLFLDADGGTWVEDRVTYRLPLGPVGQWAHALLVRRQLEAIFAYRRMRLLERFGGSGSSGGVE
ncbi:MAG: CDP-paratose 2-epimerase [Candidatus Methylomirabilia bacterium]